jgi:hypothetical protein
MAQRVTIGFIEGIEGPKSALLKRIVVGLERVSGEMTDEMALDALEAPTDLGAIARLLSDPRLDDPALSIDPMTSVLARSLEHRHLLRRRIEPTLAAAEAAQVLGISRQAVDKRRAASRLLAVRIGGDWRYPEFQFDGQAVLPGFERLMESFEGRDPWSIADSLTAEDEALDGRSLIEALRAGDVESVDRAIRQMHGDGYA